MRLPGGPPARTSRATFERACHWLHCRPPCWRIGQSGRSREGSVMRRVQLVLAAVAVVLGTGAVLGHAPRAPAATALTAPPQTNCGDMAGPVWHVLPAGEQRGATVATTVTAISMPCVQARSLAAKMIRRPGAATRLQPDDSSRLHVPEQQCSRRLALLHRWLHRRGVHDADAGRDRFQLAPLSVRAQAAQTRPASGSTTKRVRRSCRGSQRRLLDARGRDRLHSCDVRGENGDAPSRPRK